MRGRIPADEVVWLYYKSKTEVDLLQAILPRGSIEDEVDAYAALGLAGRVSEFSNEQKREYVWLCAFCMMIYKKGR